MSVMTIATAVSPFARDPFYAMGVADAYDEYAAGEPIDTLKRRAAELLDADYPKTEHVQPAELYRLGYGASVAGLMNGHIATVNAQTEVAHQMRAETAGPAHTAVRAR